MRCTTARWTWNHRGPNFTARAPLCTEATTATGWTVWSFFSTGWVLRKENDWFVRGYVTHEDAGTPDICTTGIRMQEPQDYAALEHQYPQLLEPEHHAAGGRRVPDYITVNRAAQMGWTGGRMAGLAGPVHQTTWPTSGTTTNKCFRR